MAIVEKLRSVTVDEYLRGEQASEVWHDLVRGAVYAMMWASDTHTILKPDSLRECLVVAHGKVSVEVIRRVTHEWEIESCYRGDTLRLQRWNSHVP